MIKIAMRCTNPDQILSVLFKCERLGIPIGIIEDMDYLINYWGDHSNQVATVRKRKASEFGEPIEVWNEEIFLACCGPQDKTAIGFAEWIDRNDYCYNEKTQTWSRHQRTLPCSTKELLERFKNYR